MPYKDPNRKREWDKENRPERGREFFREKEAERLKRLVDEALDTDGAGSEDTQRKHAAFDEETSYDLSLTAQKRRLGLR